MTPITNIGISNRVNFFLDFFGFLYREDETFRDLDVDPHNLQILSSNFSNLYPHLEQYNKKEYFDHIVKH